MQFEQLVSPPFAPPKLCYRHFYTMNFSAIVDEDVLKENPQFAKLFADVVSMQLDKDGYPHRESAELQQVCSGPVGCSSLLPMCVCSVGHLLLFRIRVFCNHQHPVTFVFCFVLPPFRPALCCAQNGTRFYNSCCCTRNCMICCSTVIHSHKQPPCQRRIQRSLPCLHWMS